MSPGKIAIGHGGGIDLWTTPPDGGSSRPVLDSRKLNPVTAIDCTAHSPIVIAGCRNGKVMEIDSRESSGAKARQSGQLSRCATHVAQAKGDTIVACGLEDEMLIYDRRKAFPHPPLFRIDAYENWSTPQHGFALNPARTVAVFANDDGRIQFCELQTGTVLRSRDLGRGKVPSALLWVPEGLFIARANRVDVVRSPQFSRQPARENDFCLALDDLHRKLQHDLI